MLTYCLQRTPAADELGPTAQAYADALARQGYTDADAQRAYDALLFLGDHSDDWPTPRQVIAEMRESARRRAQSTVKLAKLPTLEERERMRDMAKQLAEQCRAPKASAADRQGGVRKQVSAEQEAELLEQARKQYEGCKPPEEQQS